MDPCSGLGGTSAPPASFLIVTTRTNRDRGFTTLGNVLTEVKFEGAVLAVVRSIPVSDEQPPERLSDHLPGEGPIDSLPARC